MGYGFCRVDITVAYTVFPRPCASAPARKQGGQSNLLPHGACHGDPVWHEGYCRRRSQPRRPRRQPSAPGGVCLDISFSFARALSLADSSFTTVLRTTQAFCDNTACNRVRLTDVMAQTDVSQPNIPCATVSGMLTTMATHEISALAPGSARLPMKTLSASTPASGQH